MIAGFPKPRTLGTMEFRLGPTTVVGNHYPTDVVVLLTQTALLIVKKLNGRIK